MKTRMLTCPFMLLGAMGLVACTSLPISGETGSESTPSRVEEASNPESSLAERTCELVESGFGPTGTVPIRTEVVASGLEVPWGLLFLSADRLLVTERSGQIRLVENGELQPEPVATIPAVDRGEGGLLDIEAHPDFDSNRQFYLYFTTNAGGATTNRVERWQLSEDGRSARRDRTIVDNIPVAQFHNGGRLRFGPDGMLYIGTGDARDPDLSQDPESLAGKILRVTPEGDVPTDNPIAGNPTYILGIRNTQGFDWFNADILWVSDHGPSGELGRRGHDKISVAQAGDNLGWPTLHGCETQAGLVEPSITWREAVPPGGAAIYTGEAIPEWQGDLIVGALGSRHLQRVQFDPDNPYRVAAHEVYLQDQLGRIREVKMGPDGELYVTTSNCDGRGSCPTGGDQVLRITSPASAMRQSQSR
ncbi:PQQ-dependent sugar dehydrogenase [Synechococcales cyanobacterium C]|uniref:PQQ-dependent sugar dehydrogenase n=1 Tax=Petrachloros mirabilis ULC683 TaxID=2781853 RepID=A0A8K1ZY55_9CYAN|nr:PQQ-dependent sugar dehydrogenase [Petrachloros mirabilis]NCJ07023.1 PQQ-dependent sugar dehydrogenase [Petrachloros mirabilis ULC683]